jgi:hypothetical protein
MGTTLAVHRPGKPKPRPASATPDLRALGLVESAWLFTCGDESVRIVRLGHRDAGPRLLVQGPGASRVVHDFDDMLACTIHQSELERRLVAQSYSLLGFKRGTTVAGNSLRRGPKAQSPEPVLGRA